MIKTIQIYTAGCPRSMMTVANLKKAVKELGIEIEVENIKDPDVCRQHNVGVYPTIRINEEIKSEGVFRDPAYCKDILREYL
jgi:hypothetical protein